MRSDVTTTTARFDPALCRGYCPVCGAGVGAEPGRPVAMHQRAGTRETCPGSGAPAS
jgi:hypothetical protein